MKPQKKIESTFEELFALVPDVELPAFMGNLQGQVKINSNDPVHVYITLYNGEVLEVVNRKVENRARMRVWIGCDQSKKLLQVLRTRDVYLDAPYPDVFEHAAANHQWPNFDTLWMLGEQFVPGLVVPDVGLKVKISGFVYYLNGWHVLPTQIIDLISSAQTSEAIFTLVEVDAAGIIYLVDGLPVASRDVLEYSDIPDKDPSRYPLFAAKMYAGQTKMVKTKTSTDIIDLRWSHFSAGAGIVDAADVTYTPAVPTDWDGCVEPAQSAEAMDQLADRVTDLEGSTPPVTTAENDFQVGGVGGTLGTWVKKTLAEIIAILPFSLVDGTRPFTGTVAGVDPVNSADLVTLHYLQDHTGFIKDYYQHASSVMSSTYTESETNDVETLDATPVDTLTLFYKTSVADTPAPFTLRAGSNIDYHFNAKVSSVTGVKLVTLQMRLFYVDSDGTSNKTAVAGISDASAQFTNTTKTYIELHSHVAADITVPAGKRLWIEIYANTSGASANYPDVWMYRDSIADHISFGVSGTILSNFVPTTRVITATAPITIAGTTSADLSADRTIAITAASGSVAGSMSAAHYTLVNKIVDVITAGKTVTITAAENSGISFVATGATVTIPATGTVGLLGTAQTWTALQSITINDAVTAGITNALQLTHTSSGTAAAGFGTGFLFNAEASTGVTRNQFLMQSAWSDATDASRRAKMTFWVYDSTSARTALVIFSDGTLPTSAFTGYVSTTLAITDPSASSLGIQSNTTMNATVNNAFQSAAMSFYNRANVSAGATLSNSQFGILGFYELKATNAGTITAAYGVQAFLSIIAGATGTLTGFSAFDSNFSIGAGTVAIGSFYNFHARNFSALNGNTLANLYALGIDTQTAAATNIYGVLIGDITGGVTINRAISTGKGLVVLGDQVAITGWQDVNQLKVTGFTTQTLPVGYLIDNTSATNVVRNVLQIETQSTGTPTAGLGVGLLFALESSTTVSTSAGRVYAVAIDNTHATRKYALVGTAFDTAEREGWRVEASGTVAKLGFYGHATAIQPSAYTITNDSADRALDCNSTSLDELSDLVGTLVKDLQSTGMLG